MAEKKIGKQTVSFEMSPYIIGSAAVGGKKEGDVYKRQIGYR